MIRAWNLAYQVAAPRVCAISSSERASICSFKSIPFNLATPTDGPDDPGDPPPQIPTTAEKEQTTALKALRDILDRRAGIYLDLADAPDYGAYVERDPPRDDEEILTEPLFGDFLERVLGFPPDAYFPQFGKSGLKPDFTPMDLIAQPFVLDAKSSRQRLADHERQIRAYIAQRHGDRLPVIHGAGPTAAAARRWKTQ